MAARKRPASATTKKAAAKKAPAKKATKKKAATTNAAARKASDAPPRFNGWPAAAIDFYERLAADNSKTFWAANKEIYERDVRGPFESLDAEIEAEFGPMHIFRPYRDVRFSKDKTPYKEAQGGVTEGENGEHYYVAISAEGLMIGAGYWRMASDQLDRYRQAIDRGTAVAALEKAVAAIEKKGYELGGEALKTAPRGYPRDHPNVRWLRHKGLHAWKVFGTPAWVSTRTCFTRVTEGWRTPQPLYDWLTEHVGPSELPPEDWG